MGLFGPPDIEKLKAKGDIKGLVKALSYFGSSLDFRNREMDKIREASAVRRAAARALGQVGDPRAVEPLIATLEHWGDADVRKAAAEALVKIGAPAVEPLIAALKDEVERVRKAAAETLVKIGAPAVEPLIAAWRDSSNWHVRQAAVGALGQIGDARAVKPLIGALKNRDEYMRKAAAWALGQIGDPRAVEPLIAALKDEVEWVRKAAAWALVKIGAPAVEPLIAALKDGDKGVRRAAAEVLDELKWQPGCDEAGAYYWTTKRQWNECVKIGAPAVEPLSAALKDWDADVRRAAAWALGQIGDARAVEPLSVALRDADKNVREAAVGALDKLKWQPGNDEAGAYYWITKRKWGKCVEIGAPAVEPLIAAFKDWDADVRLAAAETLGQIGALAVRSLIAALKDGEWDVRKAAVEALVKIYSSGKLDDKAKRAILAQRTTMLRLKHHDVAGEHDDISGYHIDHDCPDNHTDYRPHTDRATKPHEDKSYDVNFPL
jgi:HEAT repeat protein